MTDPAGPWITSPVPVGADDDDWTPVVSGESGAAVFRSSDGTRYAKCVPAAAAAELAGERDRVAWLNGQEVPGPRVLEWHRGDAGACLVTSAVPGVPADRVSDDELRGAWGNIAAALRRLHELPVAKCPFRWGLDAMVELARDVVGRGAVNPRFLPVEQQNTPATELLAHVVSQLPRRREQEAADTVVCHGDLCLPNIILDPETLGVSGFIDLGRLGPSDRYIDVALLLTNARETWADERRARTADEVFARRYGIELDDDRLRFYLRLDPLTWG